jgi:hypothetical protein
MAQLGNQPIKAELWLVLVAASKKLPITSNTHPKLDDNRICCPLFFGILPK